MPAGVTVRFTKWTSLEYPAEIVELATSTAARLMAHVAQRIEPFDRAADHWLDQICRQ